MFKAFKGILLILALTGVYLGLQFLFVRLFAMLYNPSMEQGQKLLSDNIALMNPVHNFQVLIPAICAAVISLLIFIAIYKIRNVSFLETCGFNGTNRKNILLSICIGIAITGLLLAIYFPSMFYDVQKVINMLSDNASIKHFGNFLNSTYFWRMLKNTMLLWLYNFIFIIPIMGILIPTFEEILFRGVGFNILQKSFGKIIGFNLMV